MSTKEDLINVIRSWVKNDNEIKHYQEGLKQKKLEKKNLTNELVEIMKTNDIDCFDVTGGKIMYTKTKTKQSVSKKLLLSTLSEYFKDDDEMATQVTNHILEARTEKITESIRRKENK
jgi:hypothetical protein